MKKVCGGETCQLFAPSEIILPIYTTISSSAVPSAYHAITPEAAGKHDLPPLPCMPIFPDTVLTRLMRKTSTKTPGVELTATGVG